MSKMLYLFLLASCLSIFSQSSGAQEYGALIGIHQTDAEASSSGVTVDGKLNFKLGLAVIFELMPQSFFRTGLLYDQRHFKAKSSSESVDVKFDYFDVPALFQYNLNEMVGLFGGLTIGVNVSDKTSPDVGDPKVETLIPLFTLGANLTFNDMVGFDFYYERGLGSISDDYDNFSSFGANFLYWF